MRMIILVLALAVTTVHGDDLSNVCSGIQDLCSRSFKFPVSASVDSRRSCTDNPCAWPCPKVISGPFCQGCSEKECGQVCTNKCCKWPCGNPFGIPCVGCSAQHCGQACTNNCCTWNCEQTIQSVCAGVSKEKCGETCIDVPDTLRIKYDDVSTCTAAQAASSLPMDKLVTLCPCLGKVGDYVSKVGDDPSGAKTEALTTSGELENCLVAAGFSVLDSSAAVRANLHANSDKERVIEAPVIGGAFYISLRNAIAGCALGATCNEIPDLFLRYFKDAAGSVFKELAAYLKSVLVDGVFNAVLSPVKGLQSTASQWPELVKRQVKDCTSAPANALVAKAQEMQDAVNALKRFVDDSENLLKVVQEGVEAISDAANVLSQPYTEYLATVVNNIRNGQAPDFANGLKFLLDYKKVKGAINAAADFSKTLSAAQDAIKTLSSAQGSIAQLLKDIESQEPSCKPDLSALTDAARKAIDSVQSCLTAATKLDINPNMLQAGVVSYQRWFDVKLDLPCSKMDTIDFEVAGLKATSVAYPKFYRCPYGNKVPMPNEHIPYIRIKGLTGLANSCK